VPDHPLLIHAGYHKTASSWFQEEFFDKHKQFGRPLGAGEVTEVIVQPDGFEFSPEQVRDFVLPKIERIRKRNQIPVLSSERLTGNPHSGGYDADRIAERLRETFPEAKIWYNIREQISMISSCYRQYVGVGGTATVKQYLKGGTSSARYPLFRLKNFEYHWLLKRFRELFGRENVLMIPFEMLIQDPVRLVEKVELLLDEEISKKEVDFEKRVNATHSEPATLLQRIANSFFQTPDMNHYPAVPKPYPKKCRKGIARMIEMIDIGKNKVSQWSPITRRVQSYVSGRYEKSNQALANMKVNVEKFGYPT